MLWDGCPIHRSREVKSFCLKKQNGRVWLERIPGYSPDLNPDEGVWNYLKRGRLEESGIFQFERTWKGITESDSVTSLLSASDSGLFCASGKCV